MSDFPASVAIVGLGLIGGSLGLALAALPQPPVVHGWDADNGIVAEALACGAIRSAAATLAECVADASVIVLAVPVGAMPAIFRSIAPLLRPGVIVTDVGSTKAEVCAWAAAALPAHAHFIGGHPMAGSERHGIAAARSDLFRGACYCLTPSSGPAATGPTATLAALVTAIGARPLICGAADHDEAVAVVSHLPFMLATLLVNQAVDAAAWPLGQQLAASGFRDVSRLASGDVTMHRDICLSNQEALKAQLEQAAAELLAVAAQLNDAVALEAWFRRAQTAREGWLAGRAEAPGG